MSTFLGGRSKLGQILAPSTIKTYNNIYKRYVRNSIKKRQTTPDDPITVSPVELVEDWLNATIESTPRYANTERSALLWALDEYKPGGWQEAYARLKRIDQERITLDRRILPTGDKRARAPGRVIPEEDLSKLLNTLANMGASGARAQWWLVAGVASGARPVEWPDAEWIDDNKHIVRIYTAKVKARNPWYQVPPMTFTAEDADHEIEQLWGGLNKPNSASSPSYHDVDFERRIATIELTEEERAELRAAQIKNENGVVLFRDVFIEQEYRVFVRLHMESVQTMLSEQRASNAGNGVDAVSDETIFNDHYYTPLRHTIWRACKKTFDDKLYSLADARQTFSANRKAAAGTRSAQADLGNTYTTARDHYAPASKAWSRYQNLRKPSAPGPSSEQAQSLPSMSGAPKINAPASASLVT